MQRLRFEPEHLNFVGPFDRTTRAELKVTNLGESKLLIKVKIGDWNIVQAYPVYAFIEAGKSETFEFQTEKFDYDEVKTLSKRASLNFVDVPNDACHAMDYAKKIKDEEWKRENVYLIYAQRKTSKLPEK